MTNSEECGIMLYCYKRDEGVLIIGNKIPSNINIKTPGNEWEDVGTFKIDCHGIVTLYPSDPEWMADLCGGWKNYHFLKNIYNQKMELVTLPKRTGMVLKCFESDETCYLLSNKLPIKGFNKLPTKTRRPSTDWEDIGTFHIEENKLVYHGIGDKPDGELYDANLRKINIPSY